MNLSILRNAITSKAGRQILIAQKHGPAILFGAGVIGVIATVVLACKATLKVEEVLDEYTDALEGAEGQREQAGVYFRAAGTLAKMYAPAVIVGAASIAALTGAHVVLSRRNVALTAAYAALDKGFREYRKRVVDAYGEDKDRELRHGSQIKTIVEETETGPVTKEVTQIGVGDPSIYAKWFDDSCSAWQRQPEYNRLFLKCQQNFANDLLKARGHLFLNEVYEMLGMKHTQPGSVVGWIMGNGDGYVDFGIFNPHSHDTRDFINGWADRVLLDFNVDGVIWDKI